MSVFIIWYLLGFIGVCVILYWDNKADVDDRGHGVLTYILTPFLGGLLFIYALWICYIEYNYYNKEKNK